MAKANMKNFNKGQIQLTLATALMGISFLVAPVVAYFSAQAATKTEIAEVSERTARLETSVQNTDKNITEIKEDIKDIRKALNIK